MSPKSTSQIHDPIDLLPKGHRPSIPAIEDLERLGPAGLRAFFKIMTAWNLKIEEQMALLDVDARSTFSRWRDHPPTKLGRDRLERISHVLGIYKALRILFPDQVAADGWVQKPNLAPLFGGERALDTMISGGIIGLSIVRQYLDAQRGGWA